MTSIAKNLTLLEQMWETTFTVELISETLTCALETDPASDVRLTMEQRGYDVIGLRRGDRDTGAAEAFLCRRALQGHPDGPCGAFRNPIALDQVVSHRMPLCQCLERFAATHAQWLFVLGPDGVTDIVTLADLQKEPVRMLLTSIISLLEIAMHTHIEQAFPRETWSGMISQERLQKAKQTHGKLARKNEDLSLLYSLNFSDKRDILAKNNALRKQWGFDNHEELENYFKNIDALRNNLCHGRNPAQKLSWTFIADACTRMRKMIDCLIAAERGANSENRTRHADAAQHRTDGHSGAATSKRSRPPAD